MIYKTLISRALFVSLLAIFALPSFAQDADIEAGKTLFKNNCASCHNKNMKDDLTGPALGGVEERWADYPREDLYAWIRNSQALINEGHPRANEVWDEWKPALMNNFLNLSDADIENLLAYIQCTYDGSCAPGGGPAVAGPAVPVEPKDNTNLFIVLAIILAILAVVLARIVSNLNHMIKTRDGEKVERKTLAQMLTSPGIIGFLIFAVIVIGGYYTVNNAIMLGRQQGYQPEQPIKFSHVTHAGIHKIDCQYCHDGARRSKHSVIPAANTCMNCHKAIEKGSTYGTAELTKIFASIGYDPSTDTYLPNYDEMTTEEVARVYKGWISSEYIKDNPDKAGRAEEVANEQWNAIEDALTDPKVGDHKVQGPIEWVKIHNLPDHVYFNHAQHVSVGKLECQTCHGPVEEMVVVQQYAPLSMGWCVNCHRQTEVQFADNEYYKTYARYHEELANGTRDKVTVEEIGGLECQKCHY